MALLQLQAQTRLPSCLTGTGLTGVAEAAVTQAWLARKLSNFDYLMALNTAAGRGYNDLSQVHALTVSPASSLKLILSVLMLSIFTTVLCDQQHPIFPWVVADWSSDHLDLSAAATFRDLRWPMGAQSEEQNDAEELCICGRARCYTCSVKLSHRFEHYRTSEQSYCLVVSIYNKRRCLLKTGSLLPSSCSWYLMCDLLLTRILSIPFDYAVTHLHTQHCWVYTMVPHARTIHIVSTGQKVYYRHAITASNECTAVLAAQHLQNAPDRLFTSLADAYNSVLKGSGDNKEDVLAVTQATGRCTSQGSMNFCDTVQAQLELYCVVTPAATHCIARYSALLYSHASASPAVPELYYLPELLLNQQQLPLGTTQDGEEVGDVVLPPWAKGDPWRFMRMHREALESEHVSLNLHHWIDLIFGYRQRGPAAVQALNMFYHLTYSGAVNLELLQKADPQLHAATVRQIQEFGQSPQQMFKQPHPHRLPLQQAELVWPLASQVLGAARVPRPVPLLHFAELGVGSS
eukprot:17457-Heterococcus_DN1.PRE.1